MMVLFFWANIGLGVAAAFVYATRDRDGGWFAGPLGSRTKWLLFALVAWLVCSRALQTQASQICRETLDPLTLASSGRAFLECSPRLLSGGPAEISIFIWTWLPPVLVGAISFGYLVRVAHQHLSNRKEP